MAKKFYSINNAAGDETAEIFIYEQIGEDWWSGEGVTAKNFCKEIAALKVANIDLHINSPGGSVFDGQAIYNALKRHPANVTTYVDGIAASIASVIALAGNKVVMAGNSLFMIHNPWGVTQGTSDDMRKYADVLDKVRDTIVSVYREKCGMADAEIIAAMDAETWMSAEEAVAFGFVDEITQEMKMAALASFDFKALGFKHPPVAETPAPETPAPENIDPPAQAAGHIQPQGANKAEVVIMSTQTPTAPNGAKEAAEIVAMCVANNCADKAADFISAGATPDQVGRQILDLHASGKLSTPAAEAPGIVDMGKDAKKYSYQKALLAAIDLREGRASSGLEYEIHQEITKQLPQNYQAKGGIFMPMRVQNTALTTSGTNTGKETVFTEYGELIDMLRNISVLTRMGARTLTDLRGPITFPKQTGASTAYWVGENPGAGVTQSNVTFGTMTMSPKTMQATGAISRQLLVQSTPDVEALVREDIALVHALGWDLAGLHGSGASNQPTGIYAASSVNAVAVGGVPTFGKLVDMETEINLDNALVQNVGFATTSGMAGKMRQTLVASAAGSDFIWTGNVLDGNMIGYRSVSSNQVKSNLGVGTDEHGIILANWADLLIGMWAGLELIVDPYTLADQGLVKVTSFQMVDIGLRRAESFCKATGAKLS
jgi:HK97 family phage major capsid protein/ATP-dependent Clp endopeptidase proteolytic subunit ClpP